MAKKKNITADRIISMYMEDVVRQQKKPESVTQFALDNNFDEDLFYEHFKNLKHLEQDIFKAFFTHTISVLEKSEDYYTYDTRTKLLSYYYTFFEMLAANKEYVYLALEDQEYRLLWSKSLSKLKTSFLKFIESLDFDLIDLKQDTINKIQEKSLKESSWFHFLTTLKFWLDDTSPMFEKTDIYIEKSIKASLDLIDVTALKSILDFGKFIIKEKFK